MKIIASLVNDKIFLNLITIFNAHVLRWKCSVENLDSFSIQAILSTTTDKEETNVSTGSLQPLCNQN